jgi:hypothetical protein
LDRAKSRPRLRALRTPLPSGGQTSRYAGLLPMKSDVELAPGCRSRSTKALVVHFQEILGRLGKRRDGDAIQRALAPESGSKALSVNALLGLKIRPRSGGTGKFAHAVPCMTTIFFDAPTWPQYPVTHLSPPRGSGCNRPTADRRAVRESCRMATGHRAKT